MPSIAPAAPPGGDHLEQTVRRQRRRAVQPESVVVTASGILPAQHPALQSGALIATTTHGAARLTGRLPPTCTVLPLGDGRARGR